MRLKDRRPMLTVIATLAVALGIDILNALPGLAQSLILAAASVTAIGVLWRKVLRPALRFMANVVRLLTSIDGRLGALEADFDRIVDVLADEGRQDVLRALRRDETRSR